VGKDRPVSVARLDEAVQNLTDREGDARGEIYAYLSARQKVGAKRAFWIGEALRECGVAWSSGPIALGVAGHLKELVVLLALLSSLGERAEAGAAIIAAACAVLACDDPHDAQLAKLQEATRRQLAASNVASDDFVRAAWDALAKKASAHRRLFGRSLWLRDAYSSACLLDEESRARRVFDDLAHWAIWIARDDRRLSRIVAPLFKRRAIVDDAARLVLYDAVDELVRSLADPRSYVDVLPPLTHGVSAKRRMPTKGVKHP
jgi:hypothetical protein